MTRLGTIDFDDSIFDALRDDRLVIFAGAGVSMGAPSNLASFWELAASIARGTGTDPVEPLDQFLGQLNDHGVNVHERAAKLLSPAGSTPNALHRDLLRLFQTADRVRLVTTNFDLHFETAADSLFGATPNVYRAPALPRGSDFSGIVHVHGALPSAKDLVLTDADFGRAYLTEGWARRFLEDTFRQYRVLFVGYSHDDVVMNYLARALPADRLAGRFALTETNGDWELLGIKPIRFAKGDGADAFRELYDGVGRFAERATRGALDWQSRLAELANRAPPTDEDAISEIEQALRQVHTTRFLLDAARDPEWLRWLDARKHLDSLFGLANLNERESLLANWLTRNFAVEHPQDVLEIVAAHGLRLNPELWRDIGREIGLTNDKPLDASVLNRWVSVLLANASTGAQPHVLMWLAKRSSDQGCVETVLALFIAMSEYHLRVKRGFVLPGGSDDQRRRLDAECMMRADHWSLNEVWTKYLKPNVAQVAPSLLWGVAQHLEEMHRELVVWGNASRDWDPLSYRRSAIEPHEQDEHPEAVDVLVDAARDSLESLAHQSSPLLDGWIERLAASDVPLLRRLAIYAVTMHPRRTPEERLTWLLDRVDIHALAEHHEVYRAVAQDYAVAGDAARRSVVDHILAYNRAAAGDYTAEEMTEREHFDWLSWLVHAKPDCALACAAIAPIKAKYPKWGPSDHPDFTHWTGVMDWGRNESPWSIEQLLDRPAPSQLDDLLSFKGDHFDGPSRNGLLANIREACKQDVKWALSLAQSLAGRQLWSADLWPALMQGLQDSDMKVDGWRIFLAHVSNPTLQSSYAYDVANLLHAVVKNDGKPFALEILEDANAIALAMWQALEVEDEDVDDWLSRAINRPAGVIVEFWLNGLSLILRGKVDAERAMPADYRDWFTMVVDEGGQKGGMGRSLLASRTAFLFGLDEPWTRLHIISLFRDPDRVKFLQAWTGFLMWGRLYPALVDALLPAFIAATSRLDTDLGKHRPRFMEFYVALAVFHVPDSTQDMLPALFQHGSLDDRELFASQLEYCLREMQPPAKRQLWERWLGRYWQDRLQGVLARLEDTEIQNMLGWLPHLGDVYPDAVALVVRFPAIEIGNSDGTFELRESELVTRFPNETAELLIYFAGCNLGYHKDDLAVIEARLPAISAQLRARLDEAFAVAGVGKLLK
ncbi:MAG: DUF4020 domain-containing protein [Rhodanobacter sp.]|nr:MAG: DUF4020 domain-containing protein [Rhodanobacter sp.]TAM09921.1 MAG: DUF4020 domain-containing protein [Rhodanobacter sp.]TAM34261.1 MAG: DUF4020 domain-containing protein [Rhodanobacter sp.]